MSEVIGDIMIALSEAQEVAGRAQRKLLAGNDVTGADEALRIQAELEALRRELRSMSELPAQRAGAIVQQLRDMLMRSKGELRAIHPSLVKGIAATLRGAEG